MKDFIVLIVTSERTWPNLAKYALGPTFQENRQRVHLGIVYNGTDQRGISAVRAFDSEFFFQRPNYGYEAAGFDFLIKNVPTKYDYFLCLHDDHWFADDAWFWSLRRLLQSTKADVAGNLVRSTVNVPPLGVESQTVLGYDPFDLNQNGFFLQGIAGIYRRHVIEHVLERDGIPHIHGNNKYVAEWCERFATFVLIRDGFKFRQIPPGFQAYLRHREFPPSKAIAYEGR